MTVTRVGSDRPVRVDARVICATNLSPAQLRDPSAFRQDLLYRINTIEIRIPPLRERAGDIPLLIAHYAQHFAQKYGTPTAVIPAEALARLQEYAWPGNVRELKHAVERAVIMSENGSFPHRRCRVRQRSRRGSAARTRTDAEPGRAGKTRHPAGHGPLPGQSHAGPRRRWDWAAPRCIARWRGMAFSNFRVNVAAQGLLLVVCISVAVWGWSAHTGR